MYAAATFGFSSFGVDIFWNHLQETEWLWSRTNLICAIFLIDCPIASLDSMAFSFQFDLSRHLHSINLHHCYSDYVRGKPAGNTKSFPDADRGITVAFAKNSTIPVFLEEPFMIRKIRHCQRPENLTGREVIISTSVYPWSSSGGIA